jgi:hypothetical protein
MTTLFGFSVDFAIPMVLGTFIAIMAVLAFLAWRNRLFLQMARRTILRPRVRSMLIGSGWMLSVVIIATVLAGCGKGH